MHLKVKLNKSQQKEFDSWVFSIYVSAMEGGNYGSGYWCEVLKYHWNKKDDTDFKSVIRVSDEYRDDKDKRIAKRRKYTINRNTILRGLKRVASGKMKVAEDYVEACVSLLTTGDADFDGDRAGVVVQAGLFNEVIFG